MKSKCILPILLIGLILNSCSEIKESTKELPLNQHCESLSQLRAYITLTGTLRVNPQGEFVFKSIEDDSLGIAVPTFLLPCSGNLKDYLEGQYSGFTSVRNLNEEFWMTISGKYLNLQQYKNQEKDFEQLEFVFDWVAIEDNPLKIEARNILEAINSLDSNELIKINTSRCVNNCLNLDSYYKLMKFKQALNKIGCDVVWQLDSSNYKLVTFVR